MTHRALFFSHVFSLFAITTVISLAPIQAKAGNELTLHSFSPLERGTFPGGSLIADAAGNLYGETINGGPYGCGLVFELTPSQQGGWNERVLYSFQDGTDGADPQGGLIFDAAGPAANTGR